MAHSVKVISDEPVFATDEDVDRVAHALRENSLKMVRLYDNRWAVQRVTPAPRADGKPELKYEVMFEAETEEDAVWFLYQHRARAVLAALRQKG